MKGRIVSATKRDGVLATLKVAGTRAELSVVDLETGAPSGSVAFPVGAVGALVWTLQSFYDAETSENEVAPPPTSENEKSKTPTKRRARSTSKKG